VAEQLLLVSCHDFHRSWCLSLFGRRSEVDITGFLASTNLYLFFHLFCLDYTHLVPITFELFPYSTLWLVEHSNGPMQSGEGKDRCWTIMGILPTASGRFSIIHLKGERTLAAGAGWNERALINHYRCSLHEDVCRELACRDTMLPLTSWWIYPSGWITRWPPANVWIGVHQLHPPAPQNRR
jgi:hypothetical protein